MKASLNFPKVSDPRAQLRRRIEQAEQAAARREREQRELEARAVELDRGEALIRAAESDVHAAAAAYASLRRRLREQGV